MKKLLILFWLLACCCPLSASNYADFDLGAFIYNHPIAGSYDPIQRCFTRSERLKSDIASLSGQIRECDRQLADLARIQRDNASRMLLSNSSSNEDELWQKNTELGRREDILKESRHRLNEKKDTLEELLSRDTVILPDIEDLMAELRTRLSEKDTIYLNHLPAPGKSTQQKWLSSPLQSFFWKPREQYISDYLDHAYEISTIFPSTLRAVVYQKSFKRKTK